jgi:tight adherence protein B
MTAGSLAVGALAATAACLAAHPSPVQRLAAVAPAGPPNGLHGGRHARRMLCVSAAALAVLWASAGVAVTASVGAIVLAGAVVSRRGRARRSEQALRVMVCEFCRGVAAELRSGATAGAAIGRAVEVAPLPLRARLRPAVEAAVGDPIDLGAAIAETAALAPGLDGLRRLAACWQVVVAAGAMTAPAVDRVADALQDELDLDRALAAALAGPRATCRLLAALPVAGVLLGVTVGADPLGFLFGSPAGLVCLGGAGLLDAAGLAWAGGIGRQPSRVG